MSGSLFHSEGFRLPGRFGGRVGRTCFVVAIAAIAVLLAAPSQAEQFRLSEDGTVLGTLYTDGKVDDLRIQVVLDGDEPIGTYVYAFIGASEYLQRTNDGYWIPWDRQWDSLVDNRLSAVDGTLEFKIFDEDLGADNHGITIVVAYRTKSTLKYGLYSVGPDWAKP